MEVLGLLGFLAFSGSLIYLVYHFIRKIKNHERTLSKKKFYPVIAGSFLLFVVGLAFSDTGVQTQLNEALETNTALVAENEELKSTNATLEKDNSELNEGNDKASKELDDLTTKLSDFNKSQQELKNQQAAHKDDTEAFEKEIADLKATNTTLTTEVDSLKNQVASKNASSTASSSGGSSSSSSSAGTSQQSANVYYKNCTAVRAAGADPVYRGDPGYAKHLDRDGDGVGCE